MKLSRLTSSVLKAEISKRRAKGTTTAKVLTDPEEKRTAIEALLLDAEDICVLLGVERNKAITFIAQLRTLLRELSNAGS